MEIVSLGYRTDLMLLELSGSTFHDTGEYAVIRTPANPGFWWGNFLLYRTPFAPDDTTIRVDDFRREFRPRIRSTSRSGSIARSGSPTRRPSSGSRSRLRDPHGTVGP